MNGLADRVKGLVTDGLDNPAIAGSFWSAVIKFSSAGLVYAMFVCIANVMSPDAFGRFGIGLNVASFLAVLAGCGFHMAVLRWWPELELKEGLGAASSAVTFGLTRTVVSAAGVALGLALLGWLAGPDYYFLAFAAPLLLALSLAEYISGALRAVGHVVWSQLPKDILWRIAVIGVAAYLAYSNLWLDETAWLLIAFAALFLLILGQALLLMRSLKRASATRSALPQALHASLWRDARPLWAISLIYGSTQYLDLIIVGLFFDDAQSGAYFAAARTATVVGLPLIAVGMAIGPRVAASFQQGDHTRLQSLFRLALLAIVPPTIVLMAIVLFAGDEILSLFNPAFTEAKVILIVLSLAHGVNAMTGMQSYFLQLCGEGPAYARIILASVVGGVVAQLVLLHWLGMVGVALGTLAAFVTWNLLARSLATRRLGHDPTLLGGLFSRR